jgi:hypothetical protein
MIGKSTAAAISITGPSDSFDPLALFELRLVASPKCWTPEDG